MTEINFQKIRAFQGGKREAFEELCCQIYHRNPGKKLPENSKFHRYRGAGGDGGVEAISVLPDGTKWGVQSKFFNNLGSSQFRQMTDSLQKAVHNHPELTRYIFCFPLDPTGPTSGGRRGKSQTEKLEKWKKERTEELSSQGTILDIEFWHESFLRSQLIDVDPFGGLRRYWFDDSIMTNAWLQQRLEEAVSQAGKRYSPELSVDVPAFDALESFACAVRWVQRVNNSLDMLRKETESWNRRTETTDEVPEDIRDNVENISEGLYKLRNEIETILDTEQVFNYKGVNETIEQLISKATSAEKKFFKEFCDKHGSKSDTPGFRQFHAEYICDFPAGKLDISRDLLKCLNQIAVWLDSQETILPSSPTMLLRGPAGVGKTHAIVDHALHISKRQQIGIVFFGEDFTEGEPWETISSKLGLAGNISRDELWSMINAASEATGKHALVYIDAINESEDRHKWKQSWLPTLRQQLKHFPWIKLCVSCRDTYIDESIDIGNEWPEFEHNGFIGREFDAIRQFFEFYELQPPATPLLQREFANPLFLHLVCQGLKDSGIDSVPLGSLGFAAVLRLLIEEKNKHAAKVCRYDPRDNKVNQAVEALAGQMATDNNRLLPLDIAKTIVEEIFAVEDYSRSLFRQLEKEGLVSLVEKRANPLGPKEWFCRFTFDRVADFLVSLSLLSDIDTHNLKTVFTDGPLAFSVISEESAKEHRGVLEACSIILPEKYDVEIADIVENLDRYKTILPVIFAGFQWRDPKTFSMKTTKLVYEGLSKYDSFFAAMDALLGLAVIPDHPMNAEFIDSMLVRTDMTERDTFWSSMLHEDFEKKASAWRLIEWSLKADLKPFSHKTTELWAVILAWCCSAPDRRVRDRATKGLTKLFIARPIIIKQIIDRFIHTDDDFVMERITLSAYGALLRLEDNKILKDIAEYLYNVIYLSDEVPLSASIRDWYRLIMEIAYHSKILGGSVDPDKFRPPYNSPWPIDFPSEEDVSHLKENDAFKLHMNLDDSGIGTDFVHYVLEPRVLREYDIDSAGITRAQVHRWFLKEVEKLGYPGQDNRCHRHDRYIVGKYGGGRAKPVWAERLGKKYYWILLHRLAGILADHLPISKHSWGHEKETSYPRFQGIDLRDIDPTDLRIYSNKPKKNMEWWKPVSYDFNAVANLSNEDWMWKKDFPNISDTIIVTDDQGEQWLYLSLYCPLEFKLDDNKDSDCPYKRIAILYKTVTASVSEIKEIKKELRSSRFAPDLSRYEPYDYKVLFGEYPDSLVWEQRVEIGENYLDCEIPGTQNAHITTINLLRGAEFGYDCSQDNSAPSLLVPSPDIINYGNLKWDGQAGWINPSGDIQIVAVNNNGDGLLARLSYIKDYLQSNSLALVLFGYQEKMVILGLMNGLGIHEMRSAYVFDGDKINFKKTIYEQRKRRKTN